MLSHLLARANGGTFWLPPQASNFAAQHDWIFYLIYWVSVVCFVVGVITTIAFCIRYHYRPERRTSPISDHIPLEIFWTLVPTIFFIFLFAVGARLYIQQTTPPPNAMQIRVKGYKWFWDISYPNGTTMNNEMVVPIDTPVRLMMSSEASSKTDVAVIHSFFIPAFRIKRDVVPYHYTVQWFKATKLGDFHIFCAEYCGAGHSKMIGTVHVVPKEDFKKAIKPKGWDKDKESLADFGKRTFGDAGCTACHTTDGSPLVGPTLKGVYGKTITFNDGSSQEADENYIRQSIMDPESQIVKGYKPLMPSFAGRLNDQQVDGLIAYLKSLK